MDAGEEEIPRNEDPAFISDTIGTAVDIVQAYGWYIVIFALVLWYLWGKIQTQFFSWRQSNQDASYKKIDGEQAMRQHEALERARAKMQEQFNSQAQQYAEVQKVKEEKKREERLANLEALQEGKSRPKLSAPQPPAPSTSSQGKPKKPTLRPEYNPLMGDVSGGACYRPTRRGGAGGG